MQKAQIPTYERIAIDLANRINDDHYKVGEKIHGRSTLASEYKVSPETVRRAIKILEDVEIVQSTKGSGIIISSKENAFKYINRFSNIERQGSGKTNEVFDCGKAKVRCTAF